MERILTGKYQVRKAKLADGQEVLTITGVFHPKNFDMNTINDGDEMWCSDIIICGGGKRYIESKNIAISPEDFLEGQGQLPDNWKNVKTL